MTTNRELARKQLDEMGDVRDVDAVTMTDYDVRFRVAFTSLLERFRNWDEYKDDEGYMEIQVRNHNDHWYVAVKDPNYQMPDYPTLP